MDKKIYIVMKSKDSKDSEGYWATDYNEIDSVWVDLTGAQIRLRELASDYVEEQWYLFDQIPGKDYKETWNTNKETYKEGVIFEYESYEETSFYIVEHEVLTGWPEDYNLPAYFTTT